MRAGVPEQPAAWSDLCGRYSLGPGLLTDPQPRMLGVPEVAVRRGHLVIRGQIPVPAVRRGLRVELPGFGSGTTQVVFSRGPAGEVTAMHLGVQPLSFRKRPGIQNPRPWAAGALAAAVACRPRHGRAGSD